MATVTEQAELTIKQDLPTTAPCLNLTPRAAQEVIRICEEQKASGMDDKLYLRVRVVGGGCSGFQYKLDLEANVSAKIDETFEVHGVDVVVDKRSKLYLDGTTVDFIEDLNKRGFSVSNPGAKSTCGCGSSFSM
jgi:iron-sulfur cluster insertion protein